MCRMLEIRMWNFSGTWKLVLGTFIGLCISRVFATVRTTHVMKMQTILALVATLVSLSTSAFAQKTYTIGLVAKSQNNPVFQAARVGANDAAKELGEKYGI